ncbi:hypothetical protein BU24DRAFT_449467 [Aaosphaeria arxii CBS 175.79]|uniref:Uncharacterized protein n=1 Tax=Aaosphaeria arxii CBS 175.79 TaxID=1450172 RepID=A0A6A5XZ31_9PLEO|nr:uncharacterized protein BU24DRAFT_449467 [Aaosphaeria arxii CBS 175.79]KAF2017890.1 hypothetical protein BU24DRAFT_449467 [Aaosphaeria arxii CBS 175.79]
MKLLQWAVAAAVPLAVAIPAPKHGTEAIGSAKGLFDRSILVEGFDDETSLTPTKVGFEPTSADEMTALVKRINYPTIAVAMSGTIGIFHVDSTAGGMHAKGLQEHIVKCLSQACPPFMSGEGVCVAHPPEACVLDAWSFKGKKRTKGKFTIQTRENYFPPNRPGFREGLIQAVAVAYAGMISDPKNCVDKEVDSVRKNTFCTMSNFINVLVRDWGIDGFERAYLTVDIHFRVDGDSKVPAGFDCIAVKNDVISRIDKEAGSYFRQAIASDQLDKSFSYKAHCVDGVMQIPPLGSIDIANVTSEFSPANVTGQDSFNTSEYLHTPSTDFTEATAIALQPRGNDQASVDIQVGVQKVHVGDLQSTDLASDFFQCFEYRCPSNKWGNVCNEYKNPCFIGNVGHLREKGFHKDRPMRFYFIRGEWPFGYNGIREALGEIVASTLRATTEDVRNCYRFSLYGKEYFFCNTSNSIAVKLVNFGPESKLTARLYVAIGFAEQYPLAKFDCQASLPQSQWYSENLNPGAMYFFKRAMQSKPSLRFACVDDQSSASRVPKPKGDSLWGGFDTVEEFLAYHRGQAYKDRDGPWGGFGSEEEFIAFHKAQAYDPSFWKD